MNKYILRGLVLLIVGIIIFFVNKYKLKKSLKDKILRVIIAITILVVIFVPYDVLLFKFKTVDSFIDYYLPLTKTTKVYEYENHALVMHIDDDNTIGFIHLKRDENFYKYTFSPFWDVKMINYGDLAVTIVKDKKEELFYIIVFNFFKDNNVSDSLNTNFERIKHNDYHIYIGTINTKHDNNYKLIVDNKEYEIFKDK